VIIDPAKTNFGEFGIDFLGKYDAKCETALGHESGLQVEFIDEINRASKIS
jgi:hypothetical protein